MHTLRFCKPWSLTRRVFLLAAFLLLGGLNGLLVAQDIPARLSDEAFWLMINDFSEEGGYFRSDNFVSNELLFQYVIQELKQTTKAGGAYLGVGPDQNFTYILAIQPSISFIVDIRRQNMLQHLMYKALMEMSKDRADFLSLLFSRKRPEGVSAATTPEELFSAFYMVEPDRQMFDENLIAIGKSLTETHGFNLSPDDRGGIEYIFKSFYTAGPALTYNGVGPNFGNDRRMPAYSDILQQTDEAGLNRSYIGSEENFQALKQLQEKNLIVPLVGDFAGPKAIRMVADYLKNHKTLVSAFYLSNVEQYLFQQGNDWSKFYKNVTTLPTNASSTFIRSLFNGFNGPPTAPFTRSLSMLSPIEELIKAFDAGDLNSYSEVIRLSH